MPADLWSFTLDFYARPGIEQACLRLQDQGADVCMLLCGVWLGARGVACHPARVEAISALARPWQADVVTPLRALRIQWRSNAKADAGLATLRNQLKKLELDAEQALLQRLQALVLQWPEEQANETGLWLKTLAPEVAGLDRDALQVLCDAASDAGKQLRKRCSG
ncbi:TIGR02444 family protein [Pseudomonas sp. 21LCFQ02]|uniref:TIGR02444 family protein n=1 Tax=unclassified Pseudomonas TaxID=196821 RepID=UPI0004F8053E|nr:MULTISPECIES: TIGR02444 family protein [unclassified Pseudomonas]MCO8162567.1 TIGR02444 family protein [Pseudomonas sp. 21LCFQ010]MCO8167049.1 TIGR02444 family protein [Pseudomonas sp. 21LCFQ02]MCQ9425955.1 TIGR02444 family protein [Pseudomonas sp. LJDD11]BAP42182.1 putative uncharacterized protein [Pseudomonas sp. StFLB209]